MTAEISDSSGRTPLRRRAWFPWAVLAILLVLCGVAYRVMAAHVLGLAAQKIQLPVPLANFPKEIDGWHGEDQELTPEVIRVAGNDDSVNRVYMNKKSDEAAGFYIAYSGRPRTMVGHQPQVCYRNAGWLHEGTTPDELVLEDGKRLPVLLHRFHEAPPRSGVVVVLNYYILNGVVTNDETSFVGVGWRLPNIEGNPAWYVAQVQVASASESAVRHLALATAEHVLDFLPDREGQVKAAQKKGQAEALGAGTGGGGQ